MAKDKTFGSSWNAVTIHLGIGGDLDRKSLVRASRPTSRTAAIRLDKVSITSRMVATTTTTIGPIRSPTATPTPPTTVSTSGCACFVAPPAGESDAASVVGPDFAHSLLADQDSRCRGEMGERAEFFNLFTLSSGSPVADQRAWIWRCDFSTVNNPRLVYA